VQSKLFDHKAIVLDFGVKKSVSSRPTINDNIVRDPDIEKVVKLACYECYAHNLVDENIKIRAIGLIGRGMTMLREAGPDPNFLEYSFADLLDTDIRSGIMADIRAIIFELDEIGLQDLETTMDADIFMEYLLNNIRNEVISYQAFISKTINKSTLSLISRLKDMKANFPANFETISELELKLREINDIKLSATLEKNANFSTLNSERITPFFLKMAKGSQNSASLNDICDYNGDPFANLMEQKNFIRNHFAASYKKPQDEDDNVQGCIDRFLGEEILDHPLVKNLKLNEAEKAELELDFSLEELDAALEGANNNSAAGIDGYSTKFIKRFWFLLKKPLLNYTAEVFRKKRLTSSFKTAVIKLIPKKGNAADIRKWRPISLLSCVYKVISRAVNNRLKKVINRFTSRAQKGFTNHRYIQEVLINVCETINHCNINGVGGPFSPLTNHVLSILSVINI
jgi:hypothetical protein